MSNFYRIMYVLEPFLREHRTLSRMDFGLMCDWVAYYWNRDTLSYVITDSSQPRAACMIKLFRHLPQFLEPFVHDPCGRFVMIELMIAKDSEAMGIIHDGLLGRWGAHEFVLWDRGERTEKGKPRIYRWDQFERLAERITHGFVQAA